jgi:hypothetical protein
MNGPTPGAPGPSWDILGQHVTASGRAFGPDGFTIASSGEVNLIYANPAVAADSQAPRYLLAYLSAAPRAGSFQLGRLLRTLSADGSP